MYITFGLQVYNAKRWENLPIVGGLNLSNTLNQTISLDVFTR